MSFQCSNTWMCDMAGYPSYGWIVVSNHRDILCKPCLTFKCQMEYTQGPRGVAAARSERYVRDVEVACSNHATPTSSLTFG